MFTYSMLDGAHSEQPQGTPLKSAMELGLKKAYEQESSDNVQAKAGESMQKTEEKHDNPRFSDETKSVLKSNGYSIINLQGYSLEQLRDLGFPWVEGLIDSLEDIQKGMTLRIDAPDSERLNHSIVQKRQEDGDLPTTITGSPYEVAINFHDLYDGHSSLFLNQHGISDAQTVIGDISTYAELAYVYYKDTGKPLFVDREPGNPLERLRNAKRKLMDQPSGNTGKVISPMLDVAGLGTYIGRDEMATFRQVADGKLSVGIGSRKYKEPLTRSCGIVMPVKPK